MTNKYKRIKQNTLIEAIEYSNGVIHEIQNRIKELTGRKFTRGSILNEIERQELQQLIEDEQQATYDIGQLKLIYAMEEDKPWAIKELLKQRDKELDRENRKETIPNTEFNIILSERDRKL